MNKKTNFLIGAILLSGTAFFSHSTVAAKSPQLVDRHIGPKPADCGPRGKRCFPWQARALKLESLANNIESENVRLQYDADRVLDLENLVNVLEVEKERLQYDTARALDLENLVIALDIENERLQANVDSDSENVFDNNYAAARIQCLVEYDVRSGQYKHDSVNTDGVITKCLSQLDLDAFMERHNVVVDPDSEFGRYFRSLLSMFKRGVSLVNDGNSSATYRFLSKYRKKASTGFDIDNHFVLQHYKHNEPLIDTYGTDFGIPTHGFYGFDFAKYISAGKDYSELSIIDYNQEIEVIGNPGQYSPELLRLSLLTVKMMEEFGNIDYQPAR